MNAREYLERYGVLESAKEKARKQIKLLKAQAQGTTAQMGGERVQSSGSKQKMADTIDRMVDLEEEIEEYKREQREIKQTIMLLKVDQYNVLYERYIEEKLFKEIDVEYKKKEGWATTIHGRALKNVQGLLDERYKEKGTGRL